VQAIGELGREAIAAKANLTKPENVSLLFEKAKERFGCNCSPLTP